jgi:hypothetical protein
MAVLHIAMQRPGSVEHDDALQTLTAAGHS